MHAPPAALPRAKQSALRVDLYHCMSYLVLYIARGIVFYAAYEAYGIILSFREQEGDPIICADPDAEKRYLSLEHLGEVLRHLGLVLSGELLSLGIIEIRVTC